MQAESTKNDAGTIHSSKNITMIQTNIAASSFSLVMQFPCQ